MTELLTAAQMQALEKGAIERGEVSGLELMEQAGRGTVDAIFGAWPEMSDGAHTALVLCGPGNNGGDGYVGARLLKEKGWSIEVYHLGDPEKLPPDARKNFERWTSSGPVVPIEDDAVSARIYELQGTDIVVDGLFGTGLIRPFNAFPNIQMALNDAGHFSPAEDEYPRVVALDMPSGFDGTSGRLLSHEATDERNFFAHAPRANLTVTFPSCKSGHYLAAGPEVCGKLACVDIGLKAELEPDANVVSLAEPEITALKKASDHKYSHGHAIIVSGGVGKTGAARLAARGALRVGSGLVTVICPSPALSEVATQATAIMCRPILSSKDLADQLTDDRLNAICIGPGLGLDEDAKQLVLTALKAGRSTVLDADALTVFESDPESLFESLRPNTVITPHAGEFRRLFPDIAEKLSAPAKAGPAYSKVDATREAAVRAGCTILFKGPDTVISDESGNCLINSSAYERSAPWLATAGSGDVLDGFITGLLARGFAALQAAETGAWLHTECAISYGPGLIAEDLPEELPKVFSSLGV